MEIQKTGEGQNVHSARSMDRESAALDPLCGALWWTEIAAATSNFAVKENRDERRAI